jgi:hypothetical protein
VIGDSVLLNDFIENTSLDLPILSYTIRYGFGV